MDRTTTVEVLEVTIRPPETCPLSSSDQRREDSMWKTSVLILKERWRGCVPHATDSQMGPRGVSSTSSVLISANLIPRMLHPRFVVSTNSE